MRTARERDDLTALGLCLRTVLHRNFAGIDRLLHLRFSRVGTKKLVQDFNDEIIAVIKHIAETADDEQAMEMLQVLKESYRSLGRTALCLSGGGALAMYHFGVLRTLLQEGLCPQVISGTSGGSIVAAFLMLSLAQRYLTSDSPRRVHSLRAPMVPTSAENGATLFEARRFDGRRGVFEDHKGVLRRHDV